MIASIFNVIQKPYSIGKILSFNRSNDAILVYKVGIKVSKLEIKNVFKNIFPFRVIKVRTVIIKKLIKNKQHKSIKYKKFKKAYITLINKSIKN